MLPIKGDRETETETERGRENEKILPVVHSAAEALVYCLAVCAAECVRTTQHEEAHHCIQIHDNEPKQTHPQNGGAISGHRL